MSMHYAILILLLALGSLTLRRVYVFTNPSQHPNEPPLAPSSIPIVGHLIGLSRGKFEYYVELSKKINSPIFTLSLPGQKIYVVTKPDLIQLVQKQYRILNFTPVESKFAAALIQPSKESVDILNQNQLGDQGEWGIHIDNRNGMREGTAPGPEVDQMNREMIRQVSACLDDLAPTKGGTRTIGLYAWLKESLAIATTNAVYGAGNPYKDPEVMKSFWKFEENLMSIVLMPSLLGRKPAAARDRVGRAFEQYYSNNRHEQASLLTRNRWDAMSKNEIPWKDRTRFEVAGSLAFLVNTIPATFWFLFWIYSHPGLLTDVREEIDAVVRVHRDKETGSPVYSLDVTSLKANCPVMLSAYQETLRHHSMGMSVREVTEDTMLANEHLLRKGAMIQMPMRVIHTDPAVWGADVDDYRPRRFVKKEKHATPDGSPPKDVCFRAFGGGKTLCPGRHFATNEVVAVVATFVSRFDMKPAVGGTGAGAGAKGRWTLPTAYGTSVAAAVMVPDTDIDVDVSRRVGYEEGDWQISLTDSDLVLALTAEDQ